MKFHIDPDTPTVIRDEEGVPVIETGLRANFKANEELAALVLERWNAAEEES
jgi:hypothetical protein